MKYLAIIDMQKDFVSGVLGTEDAQQILPNVIKLVKEYKSNGWRYLFTFDTHRENYLDTLEGKNLPVPHCIENTEGWQLAKLESAAPGENLDTRPDSIFTDTPSGYSYGVTKNTFGYLDWKRWWGELTADDEIEICGLCTDICVVSNALILRALYPNTKITIRRSCTAGVTPETKEAALKTMEMCQITVVD